MATITKPLSSVEVESVFLEIIELSNQDKGTHVGKITLSNLWNALKLAGVNLGEGEFTSILNRLLDRGLIKLDSFNDGGLPQPTVWLKRG